MLLYITPGVRLMICVSALATLPMKKEITLHFLAKKARLRFKK